MSLLIYEGSEMLKGGKTMISNKKIILSATIIMLTLFAGGQRNASANVVYFPLTEPMGAGLTLVFGNYPQPHVTHRRHAAHGPVYPPVPQRYNKCRQNRPVVTTTTTTVYRRPGRHTPHPGAGFYNRHERRYWRRYEGRHRHW